MIEGWDGLVDEGSFAPVDGLRTGDPLGYPGYLEILESARASSGVDESVTAGPATLGGTSVELIWFDFSFMGGSMGEVAGERIARALERAAARGVPVVMRIATGGARMHEGMRALAQMAKVVTARKVLAAAHQPLIAIFGNPTTGGVLASIGALADISAVEDGATIGFAGPRVAQRSTGVAIGDDSHNSRAAMMNGLVDAVVPQSETRDFVLRAIRALEPAEPEALPAPDYASPETSSDAWVAVESVRSQDRVRIPHLVVAMSEVGVQLRGDRAGAQDPAVIVSIARIAGRPVMTIAIDRDFAPGPGGYRKARRCIAIASRLLLPIVTFIDTRGADPSKDSEAGGIAWEIAQTFDALLEAPVPVLAIVAGEGGSGGALAFAVGDLLLAYSDSTFSVIAPELAAEILWRDPGRASEAAALLKPTASDLLRLGIADELLAGPPTADSLRRAVAYHLGRLSGSGAAAERLVGDRLRRWRSSDAD